MNIKYERLKIFLISPLLVITSLLTAKYISNIHSMLIMSIFAVLIILSNFAVGKNNKKLSIAHETFFGSLLVLASVCFLRDQVGPISFIVSFTSILGAGVGMHYFIGAH